MRHSWSVGVARSAAALVLAAGLAAQARAADFPLALENRKAGISLSLSGTNGADWAVERCYHAPSIGDQVLFMRSGVEMSLAHNALNTVTHDQYKPHVIGANGVDGAADSGDEGDIYWKIDRDMQTHRYSTQGGAALPDYCIRYAAPLKFDALTYDGALAVLGKTGDNGGPWGSAPRNTTERFAYGQADAFGNEWHTLSYWDDDEPLLAAAGVDSHRQGASDGHCIFICVNPKTPVVQFHAPEGEQFYSTPVKTYHVPRIWPQTTYLTGGVKVHFVNLTNAQPVEYRVAGGAWQPYSGTPLAAGDLFTTPQAPASLEFRCGPDGAVAARTVVLDPGCPAPAEQHGFLLWADEAERQAVSHKVHTLQPFKTSYNTFRGSYYQGSGATFDDTRGIWRATAGVAGTALSNAFVVAMEGPADGIEAARLAKTRLLRLARLQPVGFDYNVSFATPAKDYLNELGQTIQQFADAGVAYDLLAAHFRSTDHAEGMTPIEELCIRDGLARIAKSILQVRANWSATSGGGDTHWSHGYELAIGLVALAMPTYKSPCYGVSGGDRVTVNDSAGADGKYWNPFPDQPVTWYQCATDPTIDTPGHPNVRYPFRAEFQYTDDGWWTGPNDLKGDGDRYFTGPSGSRLVDVKYGGLANAECRVELVEMSGYESPFVGRLHVFDNARRLKGYDDRAPCATAYIRRRLAGGYVPLGWDAGTKTYSAGPPRVQSSLLAFNNHYEFASLPGPMGLAGEFLTNLNIYYGYVPGELDPDTRQQIADNDRKILYGAYTLALCCDPTQIAPHQAEPNHAPILKALFKHVVHPGETIRKDIIAIDPDCDELTLTVTGLPAGAGFDAAARRITWVPAAGDVGVHMATVTASDGTASTSRPFPMIVKADAPAGPIPAGPSNVTATLGADQLSATLAWDAPGGVDVAWYLVYRDGAMFAVTPPSVTGYTDTTILPGTNTRYHVALLDATGAESSAAEAGPSYVRTQAGARVTGWISRAAHGAAGTLSRTLADGGVESRLGGIADLRIAVDRALDPATVTADAVTVTGQTGGDLSSRVRSAACEPGDRAILVAFDPPLAEADRYTITVAASVAGAGGMLLAGRAATLGVLPGDVDGSGMVTAADVLAVRGAAGQGLGDANAGLDVNRSGDVTGDDLQAVQKRVGTALPQ